MFRITLPHPSEKLLSIVSTISDSCPINYSSIEWHKQIHNKNIPIVSGSFISTEELSQQVNLEYQKFFNKKISALIGILENVENIASCYPPHSDRIRKIALNYYTNLGGDNVITTFYNKFDPLNDLKGGHVELYDNLVTTKKYVTKTNAWYTFNSRQYHSVENVQNKRVILSMFIDINYEDFISQYHKIIIGTQGEI